MMDSTTGRARPPTAVGYYPRCAPVMQRAGAAAGDWRDGSGNHIVAVVGSTNNEEQLQAPYWLLHQEVTVTYADARC